MVQYSYTMVTLALECWAALSQISALNTSHPIEIMAKVTQNTLQPVTLYCRLP